MKVSDELQLREQKRLLAHLYQMTKDRKPTLRGGNA